MNARPNALGRAALPKGSAQDENVAQNWAQTAATGLRAVEVADDISAKREAPAATAELVERRHRLALELTPAPTSPGLIHAHE